MVECHESYTVKDLRQKIGERMTAAYDPYKDLSDIEAEYVILKSTNKKLEETQIIKEILVDGEEVLFELQSSNLWIRFRFNLMK
jgi:hypothetical protein